MIIIDLTKNREVEPANTITDITCWQVKGGSIDESDDSIAIVSYEVDKGARLLGLYFKKQRGLDGEPCLLILYYFPSGRHDGPYNKHVNVMNSRLKQINSSVKNATEYAEYNNYNENDMRSRVLSFTHISNEPSDAQSIDKSVEKTLDENNYPRQSSHHTNEVEDNSTADIDEITGANPKVLNYPKIKKRKK